MQATTGEGTFHYYGWAVAASLAITELTSWGILFYSFSVMVTPMHADLGWSTGSITSAFAVAFLVSGISAIFIGRLVDRYGSRGIMTVGSCLGVTMLVLWSRVTSQAAFYLVWAGLGVASAMVFYEPAFAATALWFTQRRRQALTLVGIGGALASVVFVPVANGLVLSVGWRGAILDLAIILGLVTIPLHFGVLRGPQRLSSHTDSGVVDSRPLPLTGFFALRGFARITAAFALSAFTWVAMTTYLIPFLISHHFSPTFAAAMIGTMGASQVLGRLLLLGAHRLLGERWTVPAFFILQVVGLAILFTATTSWQVAIFAVCFGAGFGATYPARSAMVAERFGTKSFGQINGVIAFLLTLTAALGLVAVGAVSGRTAGYGAVFTVVFVGALIAVAAIFSLEVFSPLLLAEAN